MAEHSQPEMSPLAASFAEHVRAFHRSLPPDEQTMLEQVLALAEAASRGADVVGFKHIAGVKYEDITINCGTGMSKGFYSLSIPAR